MTARRPFLQKVGLAAGGTVLGLLAMPAPPEPLVALETLDRADTDDPATDVLPTVVTEFGGDTRLDDENASPIALWQYRKAPRGFVATSPINVVLPLADSDTTLADVIGILVDAGWRRSPEEYVRYAWNRRTESYEPQHATAAETHFGTSGRFHVRCWKFEDVVSMQVHEDAPPFPTHTVPGYARARAAVERLYHAAGWRVIRGAITLDNAKKDHDGTATVIESGGSS